MKTLAIRGDKTRGNEIIEILEMLGGSNVYDCKGTRNERIYFIDTQFIKSYPCETDEDDYFIIFTLEQFTEKFPYIVGDIVTTLEEERKGVIKAMRWQMSLDSVVYTIQWSDGDRGNYLETMIKPYTEAEPPQPAIDHASSNHMLVKEALIARFMQMPKEDLAAALADITMSNALFKSAMSSLNTQDLCTLDAKVYINEQKIDTTFLDNTQKQTNNEHIRYVFISNRLVGNAPTILQQVKRRIWLHPRSLRHTTERQMRQLLHARNRRPKTGLGGGHTVFCNPPYGRELPKWVKKAYSESRKPNTTVVMLIPARTDTTYFHEYIYHKARDIRFIKGRLKFGNSKNSAPFPSMVVVF